MSRVMILMIETFQSRFEFSDDQRFDERSVEKKRENSLKISRKVETNV
jgi:hypothetical protein